MRALHLSSVKAATALNDKGQGWLVQLLYKDEEGGVLIDEMLVMADGVVDVK